MKRNSYQVIPNRGRLAENCDLQLEVLMEKIVGFRDEEVYIYVVDTVKLHKGRMYQKGSGPNFQGGLITLCSCKHRMRSGLDAGSWKGMWVAGFSGHRPSQDNQLFYLMRVSHAFTSHREIWASTAINERTKAAKAAHLDRFGDLYRPKKDSDRHYGHRSYRAPCRNHVHRASELWHKDVKYKKGYGGRPAALLVGDPVLSFLWKTPAISLPRALPRNCERITLGALFPFI